jgi:hypothetical protein
VSADQRDRFHDNVPVAPVEVTNETKWFDDEVVKKADSPQMSMVSYQIKGTKFLAALIPLKLRLQDTPDAPLEHLYTLYVVLKHSFLSEAASNMSIFGRKDYLIFTLLGLLLILTLGFSAIIAYQTAHYIIRPLRMLNNKMINIMYSRGADDIELTIDEESSLELTLLYYEFKDLISAKKFENNDFMSKPDALAVIDLAEACNMFNEGSNPKAAGICYNNIANI